MSRRSFFGVFAAAVGAKEEESPAPIALPYIKDLSLLSSLCRACEGSPCLRACQEGIVKLTEGLPTLDFSEHGCTFCQDCALACPHGVLDPALEPKIPAVARLDISQCLAWRGVMCYACKDACQADAILFLGLFRPEIVDNACTGCGACSPVCPLSAISLDSLLPKGRLLGGNP